MSKQKVDLWQKFTITDRAVVNALIIGAVLLIGIHFLVRIFIPQQETKMPECRGQEPQTIKFRVVPVK